MTKEDSPTSSLWNKKVANARNESGVWIMVPKCRYLYKLIHSKQTIFVGVVLSVSLVDLLLSRKRFHT